MIMSTLTPELRDRLRQELPGWLREDPEFRQWILNLARGEFADRRETESRFDRLLDELRSAWAMIGPSADRQASAA